MINNNNLVDYATCACTLYAKTFLVFEAGMCISLPISRKQIAINDLLIEH